MSIAPKSTPRWLIVILTVHIVWGVARIPTKVWGKRVDEVRHITERGAAGFFLDNEHRAGAELVERILAANPSEASIILWRGDWRGSMEFVPALLAPRLVVAESAWQAEPHRWAEFRLATLPRDRSSDPTQSAEAQSAVVVLIGCGDHLEVAFR